MTARCRTWLRDGALASLPLLLTLAVVALWVGGANDPFAAHRHAHPAWKGVFQAVSDWSNPAFYLAYARLAWLAWRRRDVRLRRLVVAYLAAQLVVSIVLVRVVKIGIGRPRPDAGPFFEPLSLNSSHHALPSGHTTELSLQALPLALAGGRAAASLLLGLLLAALGFSRIYLGWHHPGDVFFGWLLGGLGGAAAYVFGWPSPDER